MSLEEKKYEQNLKTCREDEVEKGGDGLKAADALATFSSEAGGEKNTQTLTPQVQLRKMFRSGG